MKRTTLGVGALTALALLGLANASAASAHTEDNNICDSGEVCFWSNSGYGGIARDTFYSVDRWTGLYYYYSSSTPLYNGSDGSFNNVSSGANYSPGQTVRIYHHSGFGNPSFQLAGFNTTGWFKDRPTIMLPNPERQRRYERSQVRGMR